jgi:hypothetical protein
MRMFFNLRSARRHVWVGSALVAAMAIGVTIGISFMAVTAEAQAGRTFTGGHGMMFNYVKPGNTTDFEAVMQKLSEALQTSENAERGQQAAGWKVYRAQEPGPNNSVLYVWFMDPAVAGADYTVSTILNEAFPEEVQTLYEQFNGSFAGGQSMVNLELVLDF